MVDIVAILIESIQSIAVILIIVGMIIAFFWKAAFYINLGLGIIITILVTYLVNAVGADIELVLGIFLAGLIGSIIVALIGGLLCLLEGFFLSSLGFWAFLVSTSPTSALSSVLIVESAVGGAITTGIAAFVGDRVISLGILRVPAFKKIRRNGSSGQADDEPTKVVILPEKSIESLKKLIYGYAIAYKKFKLTTIAKRFELEKNEVENILLELIADGRIKGSIDSKTGVFTLAHKEKEFS